VLKVSAQKLGLVFGLGVSAVSALACGGSAFKAAAEGEGGDTTEVVTGGGSGGVASGSAGEPATATGGVTGVTPKGEPTFEPQPGRPLGGSNAGGTGNPETGGAAGSGGGSVVQPPEEGTAGDPNLPDPPVDPSCAAPLAEDWSAAIGSAGSDWQVEFGDPYVDVAIHRLVVTYDDVAGRVTAYEGGYVVAADVTLEGGTVLTPYPYSNEMRWPSLRRSSNGSAVELGGAKYGSGEAWTTSDWSGFSGISIAGTKTVQVTTYVKAVAKALAVKVSYGGHDYRSGWVTGFTWPQTNLGIMRYTGENNSRVYAGDAVYVGPLSGCQKLTDAAVEALFKD